MPAVVMTGGTSGFGAVAAEELRGSGAQVVLGARRPGGGPASLRLDLARQSSVREFAGGVRDALGPARIDALVLNAGAVLPDASGRTVDGVETTFAVNHLSHYLLLRLLLPSLTRDAVVVLTTSGAHDPATGAGLVPPRHADATLLARPDRDAGQPAAPRAAGQHAYTAAKLCTVLTARFLAAQGLRAIAYDPGQVFGTALARDLPLARRTAWAVLGTPVGWPLRRVSATLNTRAAAARALVDLALGRVHPPEGAGYAALRRGRLTWTEPSELARDAAAGAALWRDSATLTGLPG